MLCRSFVRVSTFALLTSSALTSAALAQTATSPPPLHSTVDENGVDLVTGKFRFSMTEAIIGSGDGAIELTRNWGDGGFRDNWSNGLYFPGAGVVYPIFGRLSDKFQQSGTTYVSQTGNGATLVSQTYAAPDGTQ